MTLALHGKSKQRQWLLIAAAFWAVVVGTMSALIIQSASAETGAGVFQENQAKGLPSISPDGYLDNEDCDRGPYGEDLWVWHFVVPQGNLVSLTATFEGNPPLVLEAVGKNGEPLPANDKHGYVATATKLNLIAVSAITDPAGETFQISHTCAGDGGDDPQAELTVVKTADTSFTRTHNWSIDKSVETGQTHNDLPKIWLYADGSGDQSADYTVDVTYEGFTDSAWTIYGDITITNSGDVDVIVDNIVDDLGIVGYEDIALTCTNADLTPFAEGDSLAAGGVVTCTYSEAVLEAEATSGTNTVTVTFTSEEEGEETAGDTDDWAFGDPTTETNETITVEDSFDGGDPVELGTVTAPNNGQFTYSKPFAYADYGADNCGHIEYDNTATIVETGASASATLAVNVQCYIYETAFGQAPGEADTCFIPDFDRWGWTNQYVVGSGEATYQLWAAAGQCDTSKGTLVGTVTVSGNVVVSYNLDPLYILDETHTYVGTSKYPMVKQGKKTVATVAPGQYTNNSPLAGTVYVIAHAVVGIPDPDFGP